MAGDSAQPKRLVPSRIVAAAHSGSGLLLFDRLKQLRAFPYQLPHRRPEVDGLLRAPAVSVVAVTLARRRATRPRRASGTLTNP